MPAIGLFQRALKLSYDALLDLLYFATGVLLVSGTLYLGAKKLTKKPREQKVKVLYAKDT